MGSTVHGEEVTLQTPEAASFRPRAHQVRPLSWEETRAPGWEGRCSVLLRQCVTAAACSQTEAGTKSCSVPSSPLIRAVLLPSAPSLQSACLNQWVLLSFLEPSGHEAFFSSVSFLSREAKGWRIQRKLLSYPLISSLLSLRST